jgi:hypothetical protein
MFTLVAAEQSAISGSVEKIIQLGH